MAKPSKSSIPDRNMPDIATTTVSPDTSTERPEVAAAIRSAVSGSRPRVALLALAAQVEHAVVDAHRQADQQHHRAGRAVERQPVADQGEQPVGGQERREGQPDREDRRQEGAEGDQQDAERQRYGGPLGPLKSLPIVSLNHWFADPSPNSSIGTPGWAVRVAATASRIGCTRSAAVIGSPRHRDAHQHRAAVGGDQAGW